MKSRDIYWRRYKIQETLYIGQWCFSTLQSRHLGTSHSSPRISSTVHNTLKILCWNLHQLPCCIFLISLLVWNPFPFKDDFSFGKSKNFQGAKSGLWGAESPVWFDASPKNSVWDMMDERAHCHDKAGNHQLPIAAAVFIILHLSTNEEPWGSALLISCVAWGSTLVMDNTFLIRKHG